MRITVLSEQIAKTSLVFLVNCSVDNYEHHQMHVIDVLFFKQNYVLYNKFALIGSVAKWLFMNGQTKLTLDYKGKIQFFI